ncbi:MAG: hypothetical protein PHD19_11495 [Dechloromonas sp.]|nr:hypothetical protein [Dechloromonas sp.]
MTPREREAAIRRAMREAQRELIDLDEEAAAALMRLYRWAAESIAQEIFLRADGDGTLALAQLADLRRQIEARLAQLEAGRNTLLNEALGQAARIGGETFVQAGVVPAASMRLPEEALRFVRGLVAADGLQLSDRLWRIDRGARDAVVNALERAVVLGHGAVQAAREFLDAAQPVPADIQAKMKSAGASAIARDTRALMTGEKSAGGPLAQSMRVFRTEINRAHGVAYMKQAEAVPGFVGIRFTLSPQHPKPDICDELAKEDRFGLGEGVFPSVDEFLKVWPAHPNTFSFPVAVFG